jgi:hypothetical protein
VHLDSGSLRTGGGEHDHSRAISPPWLSGHVGARQPHDRRDLGNLAPHELLMAPSDNGRRTWTPSHRLSSAVPIRETVARVGCV